MPKYHNHYVTKKLLAETIHQLWSEFANIIDNLLPDANLAERELLRRELEDIEFLRKELVRELGLSGEMQHIDQEEL